MQNAGLDEAQAGIKIAVRNIDNLRYADDTTLTAESEEELKSLLMKLKEESEKIGIWSHHFMANRWRNSGNSGRLYFGGTLKLLQLVIAAMKLKDTSRKKGYDQPRQHIKKQRHYFVNKGPSSQGYDFSSGHVWM